MASYDRLYLSPHLDDAVFSCGGRIFEEARAGLKVLIATVTTSDAPAEPSPLARFFHERAGLGSGPVARRRREDRQAAEMLGAEVLHLDLPDAIYRAGPSSRPLYPWRWRLLLPPRPADLAFRLRLRKAVAALPPHERLLLPCGIGGHVDHRLTRAAAEDAAGACGAGSGNAARRHIFYWEDFPYALSWHALGPRPPATWRREVFPLSEEAIEARIRASAAYASQVRYIFGGEERLGRQVRRAVRGRGGERYWLRA